MNDQINAKAVEAQAFLRSFFEGVPTCEISISTGMLRYGYSINPVPYIERVRRAAARTDAFDPIVSEFERRRNDFGYLVRFVIADRCLAREIAMVEARAPNDPDTLILTPKGEALEQQRAAYAAYLKAQDELMSACYDLALVLKSKVIKAT